MKERYQRSVSPFGPHLQMRTTLNLLFIGYFRLIAYN